MYDFIDTNQEVSGISAPSDDLLLNGKPLSEQIPGYRQLTVSGRGLVNRKIDTSDVPFRRGVWFNYAQDEFRIIEVTYQLEKNTSQELREAYSTLNKLLRNSDKAVRFTFRDEQDFEYKGYFQSAEDFDETNLTVVNRYQLICPDPYKKRTPQRSTNGLISLENASYVLPETIVINPSGTNVIRIKNHDKEIVLKGSYSSNAPVTIEFKDMEVIVRKGTVLSIHEVQLFSDLETFYLHDGDQIQVVGGTIHEVTWRDETL